VAGQPTHADLASAIQAYAQKYNAKAAVAILAEFGYKGAQSVPPDYIPFMMQKFAV
jgi:hypothetical protein